MIEPQEGVIGVCLSGERGVCVFFFTKFPTETNEVGLCNLVGFMMFSFLPKASIKFGKRFKFARFCSVL
jgi:hypothetical protein